MLHLFGLINLKKFTRTSFLLGQDSKIFRKTLQINNLQKVDSNNNSQLHTPNSTLNSHPLPLTSHH